MQMIGTVGYTTKNTAYGRKQQKQKE